MRKGLVKGAVLASLLLGLPAAASADIVFNFTRIADTNTVAPGGTGRFTGFDEPSLSNGNVSFRGFAPGRTGIFARAGGALQVVADNNTPFPGGSGNFQIFGLRTSISGSNVAFRGSSGTQQAIVASVGGALEVVFDRNMTIPGGSGSFTLLSSTPSISGTNVAVRGEGVGQQGIYARIGGVHTVVADRNTPIPGGSGNFNAFGFLPAISGQNVAFRGFGSGIQDGIYVRSGSDLRVVADTNTPIPGGSGNFDLFLGLALSGDSVAFLGYDSAGAGGVYRSVGGQLQVIANTNTLVPGGAGRFSSFGDPFESDPSFVSLSEGNVAFIGYDANGNQGIYTTLGGTLQKVIDLDDRLDGRTPILFLGFREALSGNALAFRVGFSDFSEGIYLAQAVPEPASLVLLSIGALGLLGYGWRRRHRAL
jgi:hypothetical protein